MGEQRQETEIVSVSITLRGGVPEGLSQALAAVLGTSARIHESQDSTMITARVARGDFPRAIQRVGETLRDA